MDKYGKLEKRITEIEKRNKRVELDKAWETSYARKIFVAIFTYLSIVLYLKYIIKIEPWLNAIIPTLGFLLSTSTLPFFRKLWNKYIYKK
ncbi:MAG: hypothetical protein WCT22_00080 [Patescibacteria group bacterium]